MYVSEEEKRFPDIERLNVSRSDNIKRGVSTYDGVTYDE